MILRKMKKRIVLLVQWLKIKRVQINERATNPKDFTSSITTAFKLVLVKIGFKLETSLVLTSPYVKNNRPFDRFIVSDMDILRRA